jgi:hypothetical protein
MFTERLQRLSNRDLLDVVYETSQPDAWDGEFTVSGNWEREETRRILEARLHKGGFLPGPDKKARLLDQILVDIGFLPEDE